MWAFAKYVAATTSALAIVVLLCATVQQWDEQGASTALTCLSRCT
ncbi:hypothetical protein SAMN05443245_3399 [Paraburkholderia fungorum]|uniref:Uncharacterized protein n=1 Tax=Paraburkholderia fungorum TaxID=134537 RepID=A0A1H1GZA9_9BURK|nr:hypothetical protein SAMN05443245_3399 [Paraburkholderia fungorum]